MTTSNIVIAIFVATVCLSLFSIAISLLTVVLFAVKQRGGRSETNYAPRSKPTALWTYKTKTVERKPKDATKP